jgi:hypothetical protein
LASDKNTHNFTFKFLLAMMEIPQKRLKSQRSINGSLIEATKLAIVHGKRSDTPEPKEIEQNTNFFITQTKSLQERNIEKLRSFEEDHEHVSKVQMVETTPLQPPSLSPQAIFSPSYTDSGSEFDEQEKELSAHDQFLAQMEKESYNYINKVSDL